MNSESSPKKSAVQLARAEKRRVAAVEGAFARAQVDTDAIAIRKNMERLRALRLAKEAQDAAAAASAPPVAQKKKKAAGSSTNPGSSTNNTTAKKLSDFLAREKESGRSS